MVINRSPQAVMFAPVYGVNPLNPDTALHGNATTNGGSVDYTGHLLLSGTTYTATLWGRASDGSTPWIELYQTHFRAGSLTLLGIFGNRNLVAQVPWVTVNGTSSDFQVRAWDNHNGSVGSWQQALANPSVASGVSTIFTIEVPTAPSDPAFLVGLTSFNLTIVPEPAMALLSALAGAALLWRRRVGRKS